MKIEETVKVLEEQMEIDKKYFFEHPEPGLKEIKTAEYIVKRLKEIGYKDINTNIYATGIVATLVGEKERRMCFI